VDVEQLVEFAKNPNSKFYECQDSNYRRDDDTQGKSFIRLGLGPGGSYFSVFTKNLVEFLKSGDRIVSVVSIPDSTIERTMSEDAAKHINPDSYVSANHCQSGSSLSLSYLARTVIEGVPTLAKWPGVEVPIVTIHPGDSDSEDDDLSARPGVVSEQGIFDSAEGVDFSSGPETVEFSPGFNEDIRGVDWGTNVKTLIFGNYFNQPVVGVDWGNVEVVIFGDGFDQPLIGINWKNVNEVLLGNRFDHPVVGVDWGIVTTLMLGDSFNQYIEGVNWGIVRYLYFGEYFNQSIIGVDWGNVWKVAFGASFDLVEYYTHPEDENVIDWKNVEIVGYDVGYGETEIYRPRVDPVPTRREEYDEVQDF